jgi:hypothetical protein
MVILALFQHIELREDPIGYFDKLLNGANSLYHPFLYTLIIAYIPIGILRLIISFISNFFELAKKKK